MLLNQSINQSINQDCSPLFFAFQIKAIKLMYCEYVNFMAFFLLKFLNKFQDDKLCRSAFL